MPAPLPFLHHRELVYRPLQFHKRRQLLIRTHKWIRYKTSRLTLTFKFNKRAVFFVGVHNEASSVVALRVDNPDRLPVGITSRTHSAKPVGVGLRRSNCFPNVSPARSADASFLITLSDDGASFGFSANVS